MKNRKGLEDVWKILPSLLKVNVLWIEHLKVFAHFRWGKEKNWKTRIGLSDGELHRCILTLANSLLALKNKSSTPDW